MKRFIISLAAALIASAGSFASDTEVIKLGIIGLDTSHSTAFTELLNSGDQTNPYVQKFEVVAAYPYGSTTIESSYKRIPSYIEAVKKHGVKITSSIAEMLDMVDCVLLETNDGRLHLEQAEEVFRSGKPVYIDKPVGATLGETIAIFDLARLYGVQTFSSSALRYSPKNVELREGKYGKILGADCYSPHHPEPTHPDFGFYGIHGVETLYTLMGTGCEKVGRVHSEMGDICTGVWNDGRLGTFRAVSVGPNIIYGGTAITPDGPVEAGGYAGYMVLLEQILKFFETGICPIDPEETIEIFTFMKASNMSVERGGAIVTMEEAYKAGRADADRLLRKLRLNVIDPGHFHAALVQKSALKGISDTVRVFAPEGNELQAYLDAVESYNSRSEHPTCWTEELYTGKDFLKKLPEGNGDIVILAGNNARKASYILEAVSKGYNVLADKPMAINQEGYKTLKKAYEIASSKGLVIMDLMTERYDALNIAAREIISDPQKFGTPVSANMTSVHYFYKNVNGNAITRPEWYYDTEIQGEGIADVTTHLIDMAFWQCFPGQTIRSRDIKKISASHFPTTIKPEQYFESTGGRIDKNLSVNSNGEINFNVNGVDVTARVRWRYTPAPGGSDEYETVFTGTKGTVTIVQNSSTGYVRQLWYQPKKGAKTRIEVDPSLILTHEDHFNKVAAQFLEYVKGDSQIPEWETENTLTKYYITTTAVKQAK